MKKFLSMVMALAMTLTLVTVGASAKDFTDKSSINYDEAVSVISSLKVVDGYTDGSFNPTATLTRGAAAKIICNMILGPTTASALGVTSAPFKDVPVSNVFAGYIAYCSQAGIINGYADGTFKPTATVTGYQFMKMLLGALGYDGSIEGFTGTNWTVNVAKLAVSIGLDDGNDSFLGSKAMTREEAALYAFNTLQADVVKYQNKGTSITVGGVEIATGATAAENVTITSEGTANYAGNGAGAPGLGTQQFCEKYFPKLKLNPADTDGFGRTANTWTYDTTTDVGTWANVTPAYTFTVTKDKTTSADVVTAIKNATTTKLTGLDGTVYMLNGAAKADAGTNAGEVLLKAGDKVEVYTTSGTNTVTSVVVMRYTSAKVNSNPSTNISTADKNNDVTYYTSLTDTTATATKDTQIPGFDASTYVKGAIIAVALKADNSIIDSYLATKVEGSVTAYTSGASYTLGGTKYTLSGVANDNINGTVDFKSGVYDLFLSKEGYVLRSDTVAGSVAITDVYYVTTSYLTADSTYGTANYSVYAQCVSMSGTVSNTLIGVLTKETVADGAALPAGSYTVSNGAASSATGNAVAGTTYYTLKGVAALASGKVYTFANVTSESYKAATLFDGSGTSFDVATNVADSTLKTSSTKFASSYYLTSSTNYVLVKSSLSDLAVKTYTGPIALDIANMGNGDGGNVVIYLTDSDSNMIASYVIIPTTSNTLSNTSHTDLLYAYNTDYSVVSADNKTVSMYDMNGNVVTVTIDRNDTVTNGKFYSYSTDADGVYSLDEESESASTVDVHADGFTSAVVMAATYTGKYGTLISATNTSNVPVADVEAGSAKVIDLRSSSAMSDDLYTGVISNLDALQAADSISGCDVTFDAFVGADGVQVIFVTAVTDAA